MLTKLSRPSFSFPSHNTAPTNLPPTQIGDRTAHIDSLLESNSDDLGMDLSLHNYGTECARLAPYHLRFDRACRTARICG
jgi:hypothetical protein